MSYNFELAVSAIISAKVAEEMIRKIVEEQTEKKVASIEPTFKTVTKGNGANETTDTVFTGFLVNFAEEKKSLSNAITDAKPFKVQTYS